MANQESNDKMMGFGAFLHEIQDESDRGAALFAASWLDRHLEEILLSFLLDCSQSKKLITEGNSPISTFSARQKLAYSLGLISKLEYDDCDIIRGIRNDFAHSSNFNMSFDTRQLADKCRSLHGTPGTTTQEKRDSTPRQLFNLGVAALYMRWMLRTASIQRLTRPDWESITFPTE